MRFCPRVPSTAGRSATLWPVVPAGFGESRAGQRARLCEDEATGQVTPPAGAQVGAGGEAASQTSSPLKLVPAGGLGAGLLRPVHTHPSSLAHYKRQNIFTLHPTPAALGSLTQHRWAKCPSHQTWGGCPGFSIGEGTLVPQDPCLIGQNLCRKSASALPKRPGESSEGKYLALAVSPCLAEKVLECHRLH